jgi:hypothetical protein
MPQPAPPLTMTCPASVAPQTPFRCDIRLVPLEPADLYIRVPLPMAVFHVSHGENAVLDPSARTIVFRVDPVRDTNRPFSFELIAERSAAGRDRPLTAELVDGAGSAVIVAPDVAAKSTTASMSVSVTPVPAVGWFHPDLSTGVVGGAALSGALALLALIWFLRRGRRALARAPRRPGFTPVPRDRVMSRAVLCLVSAAVALFALPAPVESIRSRTAYTATTCTVLDRAASGVPYSGSKDDITDDIAEPMAAVRYRVGAVDRISTGFNVRGSLRTAWSEGAYRTVPVGAEYPCWYDPARPERVVLRRGPTAGALLTLIPIAVFVLGARAFVRAWRG